MATNRTKYPSVAAIPGRWLVWSNPVIGDIDSVFVAQGQDGIDAMYNMLRNAGHLEPGDIITVVEGNDADRIPGS